jgi:hypothetical protein
MKESKDVLSDSKSTDQTLSDDYRPTKKKNARIVCANDNEFWTTQKQFWLWVREGLVDVTGQNPLTGRFGGRREKLLVMVRHVILDNANPIHKQSVLDSYAKLSPHTTKMRPEDREK